MSEQKTARAPHCTDNLRAFMLAAAATTPDAPAVIERVVGGGLSGLTYGELERRVDAYANQIFALGLDVGDRVMIDSTNTGHSIAVLLACATLGLPFVPVGPETPDQRVRTILELAEPALYLLAEDGKREDVPESIGLATFGPSGFEVTRPPAARVRHRRVVTPTDPAYIIFTSGTTGRPKGVVMSHRAAIGFLGGALQHDICGPGDRVASCSPFHFDFSLVDTGLALGSGATIVPVPRDELGWPRRFLEFLGEAGVTQVHGVPSLWRPVLRHEPDGLAAWPGRRIVFSGEEFPLPELRRLQELKPDLRIINGYGATESMAASVTDVPNPIPDDLRVLSIGHAHTGAEMMILDDRQQPIEAAGVSGEIYLRSPALFSGYWNDPEATARALVRDPLQPATGQLVFRTGDLAYRGPEGELYFCGRADSQVQIRGNRVELGEIERRVLQFPGVRTAVALLVPPDSTDPDLTLFVALGAAGDDLDRRALRAHCAETLPTYMVPRIVHVLDEIPVNQNGKADRAALVAHARTVER